MLTIDLDALPPGPDRRILDLGCGAGRHLHALRHHGPGLVIGADLSPAEVAAARDGLNGLPPSAHVGGAGFVVADAGRLPFAGTSFDAVLCAEVLEHLPDHRPALAEIARVLKPGGVLALSVPRFWPEWLCWRLSRDYPAPASPGGHVRIFRAHALRREVERLGFRWRRGHGAHALHTPYWWLHCALWHRRERSRLLRAYHRLLVWDLTRQPALLRRLEALLNPVLGKSIVLYFERTPRP